MMLVLMIYTSKLLFVGIAIHIALFVHLHTGGVRLVAPFGVAGLCRNALCRGFVGFDCHEHVLVHLDELVEFLFCE